MHARSASASTEQSRAGLASTHSCTSRSGRRSAAWAASGARELRLPARPRGEDHQPARHLERGLAAVVVLDQRERQVDAGRHAGGGPHRRRRARRSGQAPRSPSGCRSASRSADAQCVVARRPSSRPASASRKAPVQTEVTRRERCAAARHPAHQLGVAHGGTHAGSAGHDESVDRPAAGRGRAVGRHGQPAAGGEGRAARGHDLRGVATGRQSVGGGENLERAREVQGLGAGKAEEHDATRGGHGPIMASCGAVRNDMYRTIHAIASDRSGNGRPGVEGARLTYVGRGPPRPEHPQLLDHRPHRPRQVDAGRSHPRGHRRGGRPRAPPPDARLDGPRARARDHDQGPGGARGVQGPGRRDLPPAPDRHARPRGLHLRGVALAGRVRRRAAGGGRRPGRRGADRGQHLPGRRRRPGADPGPEQDRPAGRRARAGGGRDPRAAGRVRRRGDPDVGQDRRGGHGACSRRSWRRSRRPRATPTPPPAR